jgi:hypothetical protein
MACTEPASRTWINAQIDADSDVRAQIVDVEARVEARPDPSASWEVRGSRHFEPESFSAWPLTLRAGPESGTSTYKYQLLAIARDSRGAVLAQARVQTSFDRARSQGLSVVFESSCLGRTELCGPGMTCSSGECVSAEFDPNAPRPTVAMRADPTMADTAATKMMMPNKSGIAEEGAACDVDGEKRCAAFGSAVPLRCEAAVWQRQAACTAAQRCDTSEGTGRGTCRAIPRQCMGQKPDVPFCDDEQMHVCNADLLASDVKPCSENERCSPDNGGAHCACSPGFVDGAAGCQPSTDCTRENGGCDPLTMCSIVAAGVACTECPPGWNGTGKAGCVPGLGELSVANAELTPAFSPGTTSYRVKVPLLVQRATLTARVPEGSTLTFNGTAAQTGGAWTTPLLAYGENMIDVVASSAIGMGRMYRVVIERMGTEELFAKASSPAAGQLFGGCLAISEDTIVVCAAVDGSAAKGVNADPAVGAAANSGAAYVFVRSGGKWTQQAYLKPTNTASADFFATSAAISGDTIVIGAPRQNVGELPSAGGRPGSAYVFTRANGVWSQQAEFGARDADATADFGYSVAIEGDTVVVGAAFDGALESGAIYVFTRSGTTWTQRQKITASGTHEFSLFGSGLSISGNTLAVASQEDRATSYRGGSVYMFERNGDTWSEQQRLVADVAQALFGLALDLQGDVLVVGSPQLDDATRPDVPQGDARVFERVGTKWMQTAILKNPLAAMHDSFGIGVRVADGVIAVGASGENGSSRGLGGDPTQLGAQNSGAAYLFARSAEGWAFSTYVKASNSSMADRFGIALALSKDALVVGAIGESSSGKGLNPGTSDEASQNSGAMYIFR